jgi:hypothetical protein
LKQSQKGLHKNIKADIWKRCGYVPSKKLVSEVHKEVIEQELTSPKEKAQEEAMARTRF